METARHPAHPSPRYYHPYPPTSHSFMHDIHPAIIHQYISYYTEPLAPLDLSVKQTPITPPCTPPPRSDDEPKKTAPKIFRHFQDDDEKSDHESAEKRRIDEDLEDSSSPEAKKLKFTRQFFEELKSCLPDRVATPSGKESPDVVEVRDVEQRPKKAPTKQPPPPTPTKRSKAVRRLQFDEDKTSPVSGTIIRDLAEDETLVVRKGDIDPAFNVVEVTDEAKALIAGIDNKLGRYICRLCRRLYPDAFALAQHRCERIVHIEYRCPECDKVFNCPANLASHRRWHKPRVTTSKVAASAARRTPAAGDPAPIEGTTVDGAKFACKVCGKTFRRQAYLRKHYLAHDAAGKRSLEPEIASPPPGEDLQLVSTARPERSAFRQVRPEYGSVYSRPEPLRDDNYNTFWGKLPRADFTFDSYYERLPPETCGNYASSIASSEDSRSLDITGSEDEGSGGGGN